MQVTRRFFFFGTLALPVFADKRPEPKPNVVLFLVDNLPAWMLGSYGNKEIHTPHLDELAQTGVRFTNHLVCSPAPAPSRATFETGRTPMQLGDAQNPPAGAGAAGSILTGLGFGTGSATVAEAPAFIDRQAAGKPFYLVLSYPHLQLPYSGVERKYLDLYARSKFDNLNLDRSPAPNARSGKEMLGDLVASLRKVAAAITQLDDQVQTVVAKLTDKRLLENTIVIFTSTCGSLYGRHGLWDAGDASEPVNMYEEAIAVPMFWSWLGRTPPQGVRPEMVSSYDFLPTLCEAVSAPAPGGNLCGRSYLPLATGKPLPKKHPWRKTVFGHYRNTDMAHEDRYKLVVRDGGKGPGELYDLAQDRTERVNQYGNPQFLTVRNSLAQNLAGWKQKYSR